MRRTWLIPLCFALTFAPTLRAQWQLSGDVGMSRLQQAGQPVSNALTLGATADAATERTFFRSTVLGARTTTDTRWTGQWLTVGAVATPAWRSLQVQTSGAVSLFGQTSLTPTTSADALVQLRGGSASRGMASGGGFGATSHNAVSIPISRALGDAWLAAGRERFNIEWAVTRTRSVFGESSIFVDVSHRYVNYYDFSGAWRHDQGGWSIGASAGTRENDPTFYRFGANAWSSADVEAWVAPTVAVTASIGRTLEDLVRGVPRTRYATIGLRFSSAPRLTVLGRARGADGPRMSYVKAGETQRIEIAGVKGARVELMADFTGWSPVALERAGDVWRLERVIASGAHRVAIRIDGGEWIVPANLPRVEDDLGGAVGLITIP